VYKFTSPLKNKNKHIGEAKVLLL